MKDKVTPMGHQPTVEPRNILKCNLPGLTIPSHPGLPKQTLSEDRPTKIRAMFHRPTFHYSNTQPRNLRLSVSFLFFLQLPIDSIAQMCKACFTGTSTTVLRAEPGRETKEPLMRFSEPWTSSLVYESPYRTWSMVICWIHSGVRYLE